MKNYTHIQEYYGYNSVINQEGRRIRRMRRTEVSAERLSSLVKSASSQSCNQSQPKILLQRQSLNIDYQLSDDSRLNKNKSSNLQSFSNKSKHKHHGSDVTLTPHNSDFMKGSLRESRALKNIKKLVRNYYIGDTNCQNNANLKHEQVGDKRKSKASELKDISRNLFSSLQSDKKLKQRQQIDSSIQLQKIAAAEGKHSESNIQKKSNRKIGSKKTNDSSLKKQAKLIPYQKQYSKKLKESVKDKQVKIQYGLIEKSIYDQLDNRESLILKDSIASSKEHRQISYEPNSKKIRNKKSKMMRSILRKSDLSMKNSRLSSSSHSQQNMNSLTSLKQSKIKEKVIDQKNSENSTSKYLGLKSVNQNIRDSLDNSKCVDLRIKKSLASYSFNDVVHNIEQHQIRVGFLYLFIDNTKNLYTMPLIFQKYQKLCFLMLKKYWFEKQRMVHCLRGEGNCFNLTGVEIPYQVLQKHIERQQVIGRLNTFTAECEQIFDQVSKQYKRIEQKYHKDYYISLADWTERCQKQIMRLLMDQLSGLYQQLRCEDVENEKIDANQERIIQIIQIMFLISQLSGKKVKKFELLEETVIDFDSYYGSNYQKIMQTNQYFQKLSY